MHDIKIGRWRKEKVVVFVLLNMQVPTTAALK